MKAIDVVASVLVVVGAFDIRLSSRAIAGAETPCARGGRRRHGVAGFGGF